MLESEDSAFTPTSTTTTTRVLLLLRGMWYAIENEKFKTTFCPKGKG